MSPAPSNSSPAHSNSSPAQSSPSSPSIRLRTNLPPETRRLVWQLFDSSLSQNGLESASFEDFLNEADDSTDVSSVDNDDQGGYANLDNLSDDDDGVSSGEDDENDEDEDMNETLRDGRQPQVLDSRAAAHVHELRDWMELFMQNDIESEANFNENASAMSENVTLRFGERVNNAERPNSHKIKSMRPRLLFHLEEPNVGSGFIKEQSFSPDGRVIASPFGNCVRLLGFDTSCMELCDCVPGSARTLYEISDGIGYGKSVVLAATFSPTQPLVVAGCKDGTINFCMPKL